MLRNSVPLSKTHNNKGLVGLLWDISQGRLVEIINITIKIFYSELIDVKSQ